MKELLDERLHLHKLKLQLRQKVALNTSGISARYRHSCAKRARFSQIKTARSMLTMSRQSAPDRIWLTYITEHATTEGKHYACCINDVFSNRMMVGSRPPEWCSSVSP